MTDVSYVMPAVASTKIDFTARGVATLWLRGHAPFSEEREITALTDLLEGIWADGVKAGLQRSKEVVKSSPTMSAAVATLEADALELKRTKVKKAEDELDFDLTEYAKKSVSF